MSLSEAAISEKLKHLESQLSRTTTTLHTLIAWMVQSSVSPINVDEADTLIRSLAPKDK